jgi:hypothetical protein
MKMDRYLHYESSNLQPVDISSGKIKYILFFRLKKFLYHRTIENEITKCG